MFDAPVIEIDRVTTGIIGHEFHSSIELICDIEKPLACTHAMVVDRGGVSLNSAVDPFTLSYLRSSLESFLLAGQ